MSSTSCETTKPLIEDIRGNTNQNRSPIICFICDDYYNNPCLLSCFHTFCYRCIENRINNGQITCPTCGTQTEFKGLKPPSDPLMNKLIDLVNAENPPCANCDKRNRSSMFFCSTCGQALCNQCREDIHKAKMFASHDIMAMSKFSQDGLKKCNIHGEPYIMYSNAQQIMLCVTCFRDITADVRQHCLDIDTAYSQNAMKLESTIMNACEVQNSVRDGIIMCKSFLDELNRNADAEKMTVHNFAQGLQEAISKTQSTVLLEVQRQYEVKERNFHNQLVNLSSVLPVIQQYTALCQNFASTLNKFQFLDVSFLMIDRLTMVTKLPQPIRSFASSQIRTNYRSEFAHATEPWVGKLLATSIQQSRNIIQESTRPINPQYSGITQPTVVPPTQKQHVILKAKTLEGDGPFSNHCRSFNSQIKELDTMMKSVYSRLNDLRRDISLLHRSTTQPLLIRYQNITEDCARICDLLERNQTELDRSTPIFQSIWQEQIYRIHVERDIFHTQVNDIAQLRNEVKQLIISAQNMEPCISQLATAHTGTDEISQLKSLLLELSQLKDSKRLPRECKPNRGLPLGECKSVASKCGSPTDVNKIFQEEEIRSSDLHGQEKDRCLPVAKVVSRGVLSQLIDKVRKSPATDSFKERSKSVDRIKDYADPCHRSHQKIIQSSSMQIADATVHSRSKRVSSLYHSFGAYRNRNLKNRISEPREQYHIEKSNKVQDHYIGSSEKCINIVGSHYTQLPDRIKEPGQEQDYKWNETQSYKGTTIQDRKESEYQSISEVTSGRCMEPPTNRNCYSSDDEDDVNTNYGRKDVRLSKRRTVPLPSPPPSRRIRRRRYPHSDTEDAAFYARGMRSARGSSVDVANNGKTFVVVIGSRKKGGGKSVQKQHSWETFPPKRKVHAKASPTFCYNPQSFSSHFDIASIQDGKVKKSDSFEGHEEAVSSLVQEFQKIRMLEKEKHGPKKGRNNGDNVDQDDSNP